MNFSYLIDGKHLLKDIRIDFSEEKLVLITGIENIAFEILGGIIAGLFPIEKEEGFPALEEIMKYFSGELIIHSGGKPEFGLYMGPDPDKHILFSRVNEEIHAQLGFETNAREIINRFGLNEHLLNRKITTLSGGEKVKIALSILFQKKANCIVLHGVLPWLDTEGKKILINEIKKIMKSGVKIVILEQEIDVFHEFNTDFYFFNGETLYKKEKEDLLEEKKGLIDTISGIKRVINSKKSEKPILVFKNVYFNYLDYVFSTSKKQHEEKRYYLLDDLNFTLFSSRLYGLMGENGAGKSTIAKLITRIIDPIQGNITLDKKDIKSLSRRELIEKISYVGQFPERQLVFGDVEQYKQKAMKENNKLSTELLNKYFSSPGNYPISTLNPLSLKLLLLFSSLTKKTRIIILDEPTWGVDLTGQREIAKIIEYLYDKINGVSILLISHDQNFLKAFATDILLLSKGKIKILKTE